MKHLVKPFLVCSILISASIFAAAQRSGPVEIHFDKQQIAKIDIHLKSFNWNNIPQFNGWETGTDINYLKKFTAFLTDSFNYKDQERKINKFKNYYAQIDGLSIHYILEKGSGKNPVPLLLLHGWPYSFYSFLDFIEPLAHPEKFGGDAEDAYTVIIADLPGFAFSDAPSQPKSHRFFASVMNKLMTAELRYNKFVLEGGDFGAVTSEWLAIDYPQNVLGIHQNLLAMREKGSEFGSGKIGSGVATPEESSYLKKEKENVDKYNAYFAIQMAEPLTIAYLAEGNYLGQIAYILKRYYDWTDKSKRCFEEVLPFQKLAEEIWIYLATNSFKTSIWGYNGFKQAPFHMPEGKVLTTKIAYNGYKGDINPPPGPRSLYKRVRNNIVSWNIYDEGGHFPFMEVPNLWLKDLQSFKKML